MIKWSGAGILADRRKTLGEVNGPARGRQEVPRRPIRAVPAINRQRSVVTVLKFMQTSRARTRNQPQMPKVSAHGSAPRHRSNDAKEERIKSAQPLKATIQFISFCSWPLTARGSLSKENNAVLAASMFGHRKQPPTRPKCPADQSTACNSRFIKS
jgi:hypothetical protein